MQIYGPSSLHGAQPLSGPHHTQRLSQTGSTGGSSSISDQLDLSEAGQIASRMADIPEIRADRVQQLRAAIAEGAYDTEERMSLALDRLLDEIA